MTIKELKKILKEYDDDTQIKIWGMTDDDYWDYYYDERDMKLTNIMQSHYDWKTTIIFTF